MTLKDRNKDDIGDVYPDIAHSIVRSVKIPVLPFSERLKYTRPDTFRIYVPESEQYDSDVDEQQKESNKKLADTYKNKRIKKVIGKRKNSTGRVYYDIMLTGQKAIEKDVPWQLLHQHPDWNIIEEYEYQASLAGDRQSQNEG